MLMCGYVYIKTVAIVAEKGGVGKTSLSIHLGVAAAIRGKETVLVDLDPQASASKWGDSREAESPVVISYLASRLEKVLETAKDGGAQLVVIDTAPHSESSALAAIRAADLQQFSGK